MVMSICLRGLVSEFCLGHQQNDAQNRCLSILRLHELLSLRLRRCLFPLLLERSFGLVYKILHATFHLSKFLLLLRSLTFAHDLELIIICSRRLTELFIKSSFIRHKLLKLLHKWSLTIFWLLLSSCLLIRWWTQILKIVWIIIILDMPWRIVFYQVSKILLVLLLSALAFHVVHFLLDLVSRFLHFLTDLRRHATKSFPKTGHIALIVFLRHFELIY